MGILGTLERCLHSIQHDLIEDKTLYVELDKESFSALDSEIKYILESGLTSEFTKTQEKVADMGKCTVLTYSGFRFVIVVDNKKSKSESFYIAFKTKVI